MISNVSSLSSSKSRSADIYWAEFERNAVFPTLCDKPDTHRAPRKHASMLLACTSFQLLFSEIFLMSNYTSCPPHSSSSSSHDMMRTHTLSWSPLPSDYLIVSSHASSSRLFNELMSSGSVIAMLGLFLVAYIWRLHRKQCILNRVLSVPCVVRDSEYWRDYHIKQRSRRK